MIEKALPPLESRSMSGLIIHPKGQSVKSSFQSHELVLGDLPNGDQAGMMISGTDSLSIIRSEYVIYNRCPRLHVGSLIIKAANLLRKPPDDLLWIFISLPSPCGPKLPKSSFGSITASKCLTCIISMLYSENSHSTYINDLR